MRRFRLLLLSTALLACALRVCAQTPAFTHFEARQTHSIALTPDGTRLLALNSVAGSLSVFSVAADGALPTLLTEIPVGLEPVAVRARTNDEVWVVNEVSDSISVVSLSQNRVIATLPASDEPGDVVFAQGKAFVSCARNSLLRVFNATSRTELPSIPIAGLDPRALATDANGTQVFAAFLLSGNRTTILNRADAPAQPAPTNPAVKEEAPNTALIVSTSDPRVAHVVLDRDVAVIDAAAGTVTKYFGGVGTNLFDLAVGPTGDLWVANTEARNLVRFEPVLRGHIADHRLTRVALTDGATTIHDLNPSVDYGLLPNTSAQATALAQPTSLAFGTNNTLWVAAFGSDRVAKVDSTTGSVLARVDVRTGGGSSAVMRGPRALVLQPGNARLFVLNKLADTISVIDTDTLAVTGEVALSAIDFMPETVRAGRGFLFDARLSGNGTASCAVCHLDGDRDGLAWDLGDPSGDMQTVMGANLAVHDLTPRPRVMHPMKGPMVTQTLRGMKDGAPFHWRGDRPTLQSFNPTFDKLMAGNQLAQNDIDALAEYLFTLRHHPNPNRVKSGALPATFAGASPSRGETLFNLHNNHCGICHLPPRGTDNNIDLPQEVGSIQPIKNPSLATVYQRMAFNPRRESLSGFGLLHDGAGFLLPTVHPYVLEEFASQADLNDVAAFVLCFDTGTSPGVGDSVMLTANTAPNLSADLSRLENLSTTGTSLVVRGSIGGVPVQFLYSRARSRYISPDLNQAPLSRAELLALLQSGDTLTFQGVQPLEAARFLSGAPRQVTTATDSYFVRNITTKKPLIVPAASGVLANDSNVSNSHDMVSLTTAPTLGTTTLNTDGSFTYVPGTTFAKTGRDSFAYRVLVNSDAGSPTATVRATINTMASIAGRYTGYIQLDSTRKISGFVKLSITATGTWSATVRIGAKSVPAKGTVAVDGKLVVTRQPLYPVDAVLSVLPDGSRQVALQATHDGATSSGILPGNPYSSKVKAPAAGKHKLVLTVANSIGTAPPEPGSATLTIGKTGTAAISGKLGDKTAFSCSGVLAPAASGGWRFMIYAPVYKYPAGDVAGEVQFDPATPLEVDGALTVAKPPQTKTAPYQSGFTIEYDVAKP